MWSFFSKEGSKDSLYEINDKVTNFENESLFILFKGKIKSNGKKVSIFKFDSSFNSQSDKVAIAKASIKRLKTIRHPSIISIIDSNEESNDLFFVTERVVPLSVYLTKCLSTCSKEQKYYTASYGLCQVAIGLDFLNNDCNLMHNNVNINSIFITDKENWKIGCLDYVNDSTSIWPTKLFSSLDRYDPPEKLRNRTVNEKWTRDAYGLGCLIYEIFCGNFESSDSLERPNRIPTELNADYLKLINSNPTSRLNFKEFVAKFRSDKNSVRNIFVNTMFFLDEIQIKDQNEKTRFFSELNENIDNFPPKICKKKILPKILESLELNIDTPILLESMFKIGKSLSAKKYERYIVPVIVKLFTFKDRITRSKLLQNVENYIEHLKPKTVNEIYLNISQGFLDSNPTIREQTVKSMLHFAPKLNSENLNDNLLKNFSRIQVRDEETSIRTNATVCLSKIACYLKPEIRQKVIVMAFVRCLRDPFPPARLAALNGLRSTQMFYTLQSTATQVMPALCHLTIDQEKKVRDEAFKLLKEFIDKVHRVSENPAVIDEIESELEVSYSSNNKFDSASSWASWAVSSFTSKLSKMSSAKATTNSTPVNSSSTNLSSNNLTEENSIKKFNEETKATHSMKLEKDKQSQSDISDNEGWDIDDKVSLSSKDSKSMNIKSLKNESNNNVTVDKSDWEAEIDFKDVKQTSNNLFTKDNFNNGGHKKINVDSSNNLNSGNHQSSVTRTIAKTTVKSTKNKTLEDELFESLSEPTLKTQKKRAGAMKLGAKKA